VYGDREGPSTQRIILVIASAIGAIAGVVFVGALLMGIFATPASQTSSVSVSSATMVPPAKMVSSVPPTGAASMGSSLPTAPASASATVSAVVVIDAGHQAEPDNSLEPEGPGSSVRKPKVAGGASGVSTHIPESKTNLAIALKLKKALEANGVEVRMVRSTEDVNISNSERAAVANDASADLFIRLHCDGGGDSSVHGLSTLVPAKNKWTAPIVAESAAAGKLIHRSVISATGATDRGIVTRSDLSGFNWSKVPTVLVEMGFMSNSAEDRKLNSASYQDELTQGISEGTMQYLESR